MLLFHRIRDIISERKTSTRSRKFLSTEEQIDGWDRANQKMAWGIKEVEFAELDANFSPSLKDNDGLGKFGGSALFYGFGDDGRGHANAVFSGQQAWEYACKIRKGRTWRCEYVDFSKPEDIRLRPGAPLRPKGFYLAGVQPGERYINMTVSQLRKKLGTVTGWGPEGFQFLTITHAHFADLMTDRKIPFMALADYDVAPYGFNDFYDAPQIFCSNNILGLGIGNVDRNYPLFGIPTLQFCSGA